MTKQLKFESKIECSRISNTFLSNNFIYGIISEPLKNSKNLNLQYTYHIFSFYIAGLCSSHFNWRMSMIGMKMRISVVSAIYRKALEARGLKDSRPEILNLMSTDTDRIVNSCISFHSFWSIPFQVRPQFMESI